MAATQQPSPRPRAGMQSLEAAIVLEAMHSQRAGLRSGVYNPNPGHAVVPGHSGQQHSHRTRPDRRTSQVTSALHRAGCRRRTGTSWQPKGIGRHPPYPLASPGSRRHYMSSRSMRRVLNRQCSARPSRRSQHGADSANGGQPLHRADSGQSSPCLQPPPVATVQMADSRYAALTMGGIYRLSGCCDNAAGCPHVWQWTPFLQLTSSTEALPI